VEAGIPRIHGFVYDIGEGLLRKLDIDFRTEVGREGGRREAGRRDG